MTVTAENVYVNLLSQRGALAFLSRVTSGHPVIVTERRAVGELWHNQPTHQLNVRIPGVNRLLNRAHEMGNVI